MNKQAYVIDGNNFSSLEEFWDEIRDKLVPEAYWGRNLDAFNDILRGGFGTPDEGFILIWKNSGSSRERLGYPETIKWLEGRIQKGHPSNAEHFKRRLELAKQHKGKTIFDMLVEIISSEEHDDIELRLE